MPVPILTDRQVREIRRVVAEKRAERVARGYQPRNGYGIVKPMARRYGVSPRTIQSVIYKDSWADIK